MKKRFLKISNLNLPEIEQAEIERMAQKGYAVKDMTKHSISFEPAEAMQVRAKLIPCEVSEPGYLGFVSQVRSQGWSYTANDGSSHSLFLNPNPNAPDPEFDKAISERSVKRTLLTKCLLTGFDIILMLAVFGLNIIQGAMPIYGFLFYAAWLTMNIQWSAAVLCDYKNLLSLRGKSIKRNAKAEFALHRLLTLATLLLLVSSFVVYIVFLNGGLS